jgi:hypothetical protein
MSSATGACAAAAAAAQQQAASAPLASDICQLLRHWVAHSTGPPP